MSGKIERMQVENILTLNLDIQMLSRSVNDRTGSVTYTDVLMQTIYPPTPHAKKRPNLRIMIYRLASVFNFEVQYINTSLDG